MGMDFIRINVQGFLKSFQCQIIFLPVEMGYPQVNPGWEDRAVLFKYLVKFLNGGFEFKLVHQGISAVKAGDDGLILIGWRISLAKHE